MTIPQLRALAKIYGCYVQTGKHKGTQVVELLGPDYDHDHARRFPKEGFEQVARETFIPILEELSGKKTAELWNGGKGGQA